MTDTEQEGSARRRSFTPGRNSPEKDNVLTPYLTALEIVQHYRPIGRKLDPCAGNGEFSRAMQQVSPRFQTSDCENRRAAMAFTGCDFFDWTEHVDWIISNPPYSIFLPWLEHSFTVADNIVYLVQATVPFWASKRRAAINAGFGIRELHYVNCPDEWKQQKISFGTGLAAVHWQRGYTGSIIESYAAGFEFPRKAKRGAA